MCGITIFVSKKNKNVISNILDSLNQLQNRGYDSAGIAYIDNEWKINKYASSSNIDGLKELSKNVSNINSSLSIGHTRWATHGIKSDLNAHPHISMNKKIILVHNGIITNFYILKKKLLEKNIICKTETDSEVIANWIEYYYIIHNCMYKAINETKNILEGTWALGIVNIEEPTNIYITRNGSPLLFAENENYVICCSEMSGFIGLVNNYYVLNNNDVIKINTDGIVNKEIIDNDYENNNLDKFITYELPEEYEDWTIKEIYEQPTSILNAINNGARIERNSIKLGGLNVLSEEMENTYYEHLLLFGCGTSHYATLLSKYYFNKCYYNKFKTVQCFDGSEFSEYDLPKSGNAICIFCTQSGETYDLVRCINICKSYNYFLIGIVNVVDSYITRLVDTGVYMNAGKEMAVASTKSFTSTIIILSLISLWFKNNNKKIKYLNVLRNLSNNVFNLLKNNNIKTKIENLADFIVKKNIENIYLLGTGKMYPIVKEIALKMKEICYIHAEGFPSGSLKHGPFSLLDEKNLTILLIDKPNTEKMFSTYKEITSRETNCYVLSDNKNISVDKNKIIIPNLSYYQEIMFCVSLQYLSYVISKKKNINPDKPRNLAKVVTVE